MSPSCKDPFFTAYFSARPGTEEGVGRQEEYGWSAIAVGQSQTFEYLYFSCYPPSSRPPAKFSLVSPHDPADKLVPLEPT